MSLLNLAHCISGVSCTVDTEENRKENVRKQVLGTLQSANDLSFLKP